MGDTKDSVGKSSICPNGSKYRYVINMGSQFMHSPSECLENFAVLGANEKEKAYC